MSSLEYDITKAKYDAISKEISDLEACIAEKRPQQKWLQELLAEMDDARNVKAQVTPKSAPSSSLKDSAIPLEERRLRLSEKKKRMYSLLIKEGAHSSVDISRTLGLPTKYIRSAFKISIRDGDIVRNNGKYSITETGKEFLYRVLKEYPLEKEQENTKSTLFEEAA
ncbi:hypothetical protein N9W34_05365 [Rickettsiales bacterium]|nr:hypothetical protein [Rickettsiales bacterium]